MLTIPVSQNRNDADEQVALKLFSLKNVSDIWLILLAYHLGRRVPHMM
jgi:hypothetical protein